MAAKNKVPTSDSERWQQLHEQMGFLARSCRDFDEGHVSEAKRMANEVVKLVLEKGRNYKSLLHQVGLMPGLQFISSCPPLEPKTIFIGPRLVYWEHSPSGSVSFHANLDSVPMNRFLSFDDWWAEPVIPKSDGQLMNRMGLVTSLRNELGGAHVDAEISEDIAEMQREGPFRVFSGARASMSRVPDVELHTMRQIAHEVLRSIELGVRGQQAGSGQ
ncbi:hypothetical protein [Pseudaquabacterium pictum]|uniref:Uncharacterized protein n=1 Tax=Pseudaquabacterium pictum TaxID=2315236 RepID=A0A480ATY2_9BURK|nr:hypothetical protein [Rubrivivax pictus]GCL64320.1 hypothetical protein AQPW35_34010 [Rubrivivax pictus]